MFMEQIWTFYIFLIYICMYVPLHPFLSFLPLQSLAITSLFYVYKSLF